ncbi:transcriptional repressor, CopY family [Emticicia oligotrophica DSM 17448]|uniref:Transcriptional repressor, CopY family n=1 Tax=Emticicia oligotrophica (strain DSM 17448 / CIP 109782 / MTCC 6937 / GPTSA100-15) TaxID=929562 RepID=A0ABM5N4M0_EMTOG|nr:BlaI/MecI/CopY family transcriptional regulator [Emticicia oligotrophica]AFK04350.1 transcriptional repressor, CopY family [Emticicia oligotrophica DSM 17448]
MELRELTRAEEEVMQIMWEIEPVFVKDILEYFPEPKPAYNTVSTIVRILEQKGFVGHKAYGKTHQYYSLISKEQYKSFATGKLMESYFENSVEEMFSFFVREKKIDMKEADEILKMIDKMKNSNQ